MIQVGGSTGVERYVRSLEGQGCEVVQTKDWFSRIVIRRVVRWLCIMCDRGGCGPFLGGMWGI